jgi:hypothetical protein
MPVKLFTGLPGAGKTACLVHEIQKLRESSPDRPIFQMGINGLREGLAHTLTMEQLQNWREELPPGSIVCLDECQEDHLMPLDKGLPKPWVKAISKVRHDGCDFLLTTQHPSLMSAYVRKLVDQHVHCVRKWNTNLVIRYTWGRCMDQPERPSQQKSATEEIGTLPAAVFDDYKSAQLHNMKRKIPRKLYFFVAMVIGAAVLIPTALYFVFGLKDPAKVQAATHVDQGVDALDRMGHSSSTEAETLRTQDYAKWQRPRIEGIPWSAPMFDGLQVQAQPRVFCAAMETGDCHCMTEQGTRYEMPVKLCRQIVHDGLYNPFQSADRAEAGRGQTSQAAAGTPQARQPVGWSAPAQPQASGRWQNGVGAQTYVAPGERGSWNPDAIAGDNG